MHRCVCELANVLNICTTFIVYVLCIFMFFSSINFEIRRLSWQFSVACIQNEDIHIYRTYRVYTRGPK